MHKGIETADANMSAFDLVNKLSKPKKIPPILKNHNQQKNKSKTSIKICL